MNLGERLIADLSSRLWSKVDKTDDGCWLWRGAGGRYGHISVGGKSVSVHRVSWELTYGAIPDGQDVCHTCDIPKCVRPDHLFLGTQVDNALDMWTKGRGVKQTSSNAARGERHSQSRLTDVQVMEMRRMYARGETSYPKLAKDYGVAISTAHAAVTGLRWNHLPMPGSAALIST